MTTSDVPKVFAATSGNNGSPVLLIAGVAGALLLGGLAAAYSGYFKKPSEKPAAVVNVPALPAQTDNTTEQSSIPVQHSDSAPQPRQGPRLTPLVGNAAHGELGENINVDGLSVGVWYLDAPPVKSRQMLAVSVLCEVGNEGNEPVTGPELNPFIYDATGRKYSPVKTEGTYTTGVVLKPLVWRDVEWAFALPESLPPLRLECALPSGKMVVIDFTHGMPENRRDGGKNPSNPELSDRFKEFSAQLVAEYAQVPATSPTAISTEPARNAAAEQALVKLSESIEQLSSDLEQFQADAQKAERKVKSMLSTTARANDDLDKAKLAKAAADDNLRELNGTKPDNHREEVALNSSINKAQVESDRQARHVDDAQKNLAEKQKALEAATKVFQDIATKVKATQDKLKQQQDTLSKTPPQ